MKAYIVIYLFSKFCESRDREIGPVADAIFGETMGGYGCPIQFGFGEIRLFLTARAVFTGHS